MKKAHIDSVPEDCWQSPAGKYQLIRKHLSLAVGGVKDVGEWGGGHPFDVELAKLPPGKSNFPLHRHSAQSEFYLVFSGTGLLHGEGDPQTLRAGDIVFAAPGEAHRIENTGPSDLEYLVVSDQPRADICHYPETKKYFLKPERVTLSGDQADYFEVGD
ncbi:cupin domain-containing protein [Haloferula chungangensis]|uniref:Cupin domain-containing protein n=1 Tax=Haloferula chungangensis TaxID=1048331 RepID=A0ABW2L628_9BACT